MRATPQVAIDFVKQYEACELKVYSDSGGVLTAGYGHTGLELASVVKVTQEMANEWLHDDLEIARNRLYSVCRIIELLTDNQYAALLSFVFNLGANPKWTIWKRLNARQFDQVPLEMMKFVNCQGVKLQGLVNRRAAEVALWSKDEPGSLPIERPSSQTRAAETPPTPADAEPPGKSKTLIAAAVSAVAAVPPAVQSVSAAVAPYSDKSDFVASIVAALAIIGAIAAGLTALWYYMHKQDARN